MTMIPNSSRSLVLLVVLLFAETHPVQSWVTLSIQGARLDRSSRCTVPVLPPKTPLVSLHGILDDYTSSLDSSSSDNDASNEEDAVYEGLFHRLVFSTGDPRTDVADQWKMCSDAGFQQWLTTQKEAADDKEEEQALQELLDIIQEVANSKAENAEHQRALEEQATDGAAELQEHVATATDKTVTKMSAADVLRKANSIDQAILSTAASEGRSDFMTDAKAERGLSGFNSKGRMRVGGS